MATLHALRSAPVNPLVRYWRRYLDLLETRPLVTKSVSAFVIGGVGDVIAQRINPTQEHSKALQPSSDSLTSIPKPTPGFVWDKERTLRLSLYGLIFAAPLTHGWYKILEGRLGKGMDIKTAAMKVAADQLLAAGPFTFAFFTVNSAAEGMKWPEIRKKLDDNLWPTLKANWAIWPAALIFNFWLVPLKLRVLVVNVLGLGMLIHS